MCGTFGVNFLLGLWIFILESRVFNSYQGFLDFVFKYFFFFLFLNFCFLLWGLELCMSCLSFFRSYPL